MKMNKLKTFFIGQIIFGLIFGQNFIVFAKNTIDFDLKMNQEVNKETHGIDVISEEEKCSEKNILVRFTKAQDYKRHDDIMKQFEAKRIRKYKVVEGLELWELQSRKYAPIEVIKKLNEIKDIKYAERDCYSYLTETIPDDTYFENQWALKNTGQEGGVVDADIDATDAWDITTGSSSIIVAVSDTGVYPHEDLVDNLWTNLNEIPDNGLDDDNNGYIDDVHGYSWISGYDELDGTSHGTGVAGIIGAKGNNQTGVSGINWDVSLMSLKIVHGGGISLSNEIASIEYAILMNANIINASWGGGSFYQSLYDVIVAADEAGILFVAAAGNDYIDNDTNYRFYPASYELPNIIAVAATQRTDNLASYSNYGEHSVHLGAPSGTLTTTNSQSGIASFGGTSAAAPHVTGAAALIWSHFPEATHYEIKDLILKTTELNDSLIGKTITAGRLNVFNALNGLPDVTYLPKAFYKDISYFPIPENLDIDNNSNENLTWSILSAPEWLEFSETEGDIISGETHPLEITFNRGNLEEGDYVDVLLIETNLNGIMDIIEISVEMNVDLTPPNIIYVDASAIGNNDGSSWEDAFIYLRDATNLALGWSKMIWVAEGTYYPDETSQNPDGTGSIWARFYARCGGLFGGFSSNDLSHRDWINNETILSGDIGIVGNNSDNSIAVVWPSCISHYPTDPVIDGFTITKGSALNGRTGGGIYNGNATFTVKNTLITGNEATYGGGIYNGGGIYGTANQTLINVTITGNEATYGGGIYNDTASSTLINVTMAGNEATYGGGIYNEYSNSTITNSIFWDNVGNNNVDIDSSSFITYSNIEGGHEGEGNIDSDPMFVDPDDGDFHLQIGSPSIDSGDNNALNLPTIDFEGDNRIINGIVDMGVDEFYFSIPDIIANDDNVETDFNQGVLIPVLENDLGFELEITNVASSSFGTVTILDNDIYYEPNNDFSGLDTFSYTIIDSYGNNDTANVEVQVNPSLCGTIIDSNFILESDMSCSSTALIAGVDDITIDCNGHSIIGNSNGDNTGIEINQLNNVTVQNCHISGFEKGIYLDKGGSHQIGNNELFNNYSGIWLAHYSSSPGSQYNNIYNNYIHDNNEYGIYVGGGNGNNTIDYNEISNNNGGGAGAGIRLDWSNNNIISDNDIINNNAYGIAINQSHYNDVSFNTILENREEGIFIKAGDHNNIMNNIISDNECNGIWLKGYQHNSFDGVAEDNFINQNIISNNGNDCWYTEEYGLYSFGLKVNEYTLNNQIYWNDFIDNAIIASSTNQVEDLGLGNIWNISQGNYWSDHICIDDLAPFGVCENPYIFNNNSDLYPLLEAVIDN
jgi:parallel beta-helix repeat protein